MIKRLAESYPKALYYPFHISYEHYQLVKDRIPRENYEFIQKIKHAIRSPIMEEFCNELKRLTDPEHIVKDFIDFLYVVYRKKISVILFITHLFFKKKIVYYLE